MQLALLPEGRRRAVHRVVSGGRVDGRYVVRTACDVVEFASTGNVAWRNGTTVWCSRCARRKPLAHEREVQQLGWELITGQRRWGE